MESLESVNIPGEVGGPETPPVSEHLIRIEPSSGWVRIRFGEIWEYRELLYFLIWRDLKVRYKQTALGVLWVVLQPLLTMLVFTFFFGRLVKIPSDGVPYSLFCLTGLVAWTFFSSGLGRASSSLLSSGNLLTKVYFPRLIIPLASVASGLVDFGVSMVLLVLMMIWHGAVPSFYVLLVPVFLLLTLMTALGIGLWFSALSVEYRDINYITPFLIQFWMYATPIIYPSSLLPAKWRLLYGLNPMAGIIEGFRWSLLGTPMPSAGMISVSVVVAVGILVTGALYFARLEKTFADRV